MLPRSRRSNTGNSSRRSCPESKTHQREFSVIFDASENTSITTDITTDNIPHPSQGVLTECRSPTEPKPVHVSHGNTIPSKSLEDEINQIFVTVIKLSWRGFFKY